MILVVLFTLYQMWRKFKNGMGDVYINVTIEYNKKV